LESAIQVNLSTETGHRPARPLRRAAGGQQRWGGWGPQRRTGSARWRSRRREDGACAGRAAGWPGAGRAWALMAARRGLPRSWSVARRPSWVASGHHACIKRSALRAC